MLTKEEREQVVLLQDADGVQSTPSLNNSIRQYLELERTATVLYCEHLSALELTNLSQHLTKLKEWLY